MSKPNAKALVDVLASAAPLGWFRCRPTGSSLFPQPQVPILVWRYARCSDNEQLVLQVERNIEAAIASFRGYVTWVLTRPSPQRGRNWALTPELLHEYMQRGLYSNDSIAAAALVNERPEYAELACQDLNPLAEHIAKYLAEMARR